MRADPLTYGIDLMRHPLLRGLYPGNLGTDYTISFDVLVLVLVSAVLIALASLLFGEEEHLGRILLVEPPRPRGRRLPRPALGFGRRESTAAKPVPFREASPAD